MNDKEIEKIIQRNNKIEQNLLNKENHISKKNIIIQTKKINPFIEIIDSSRLNEDIINLSENSDINEIKGKEVIENKESIDNIQNSENNINAIEEPMTFNPNKKKEFSNTLNSKQNKSERQNQNFLTFKDEGIDIVLKKNIKIKENTTIDNFNLDEQMYQIKFKDNNICIDDIIIIIKKLIDKMKLNHNKGKIQDNNQIYQNSFVKKLIEIKKDVIKMFDNIIEEESDKTYNNVDKDFNYYKIDHNDNNNFKQQFKLYNENFCLNRKMNEIDEMEKLYQTQIINLKNKIKNFEKENNNLKKIIQNSQKILEDLIYKNKLLSAKLIKYKTLYEENKYDNINNF